jgi:hypothetical protein
MMSRFVTGDGEQQLEQFHPRWLPRLARLERDIAAIAPGYIIHRAYELSGLRMTLSLHGQQLPGTVPQPPTSGPHYDRCVAEIEKILETARVGSAFWSDPPRPAPRDPRPVVAIDVDGVINALAPGDRFVEHRLTIEAGVGPVSPFIRGGGRSDTAAVVRVDPAVVAWVNSLHIRAQVVWATTWEHAANTVLAPAVGLTPFEVAVTVEDHPPRLGYVKNKDSAAWKAEALAEMFDNRPLVWLDDLATRYRTHDYWRHPDDDAKTLVLVPDKDTGLTVHDMETVDAFLAEWNRPILGSFPNRS